MSRRRSVTPGPRGLLPALAVVVALAFAWALAPAARAAVKVQEVTSPGGISAWLVENHQLPFVAMEIRFRGGASLDPPGREGVTWFMAGLLEEGAGERDATAFAEERERLGASFVFDADRDTVSVSVRMLTPTRQRAAALLADALARPRFDATAIERVRGQILAILRRRAHDPSALAWERTFADGFAGHPYARPMRGTEESVRAITRADIVAAWRAALARDRVIVTAAGDITAAELGALVDRILGDLPARAAPLPPEAEWRAAGGLTPVPFPGPQSTVVFSQPGIRRDDPDFLAAYVLNHILGGGPFGARLMTELREKRGLTYGVGTSLVVLDRGAFWAGYFSSRNGSVGEAVELVRRIWAEVAREGVTAAELAAAKRYLTGSFPLRLASNAEICAVLAGFRMLGLPRDYIEIRDEKIAALTLEQVNRVARRLMQPERLHFVIVGQPEGLPAGR